MKNIITYIKEGFYKNVGADTEGIKEWMKKWSEVRLYSTVMNRSQRHLESGYTRTYYDYTITLDPDNLLCRVHYTKNKTDKNDIVINFVDYWKDIKELNPEYTRIVLMNRNTLFHSSLYCFKHTYGDNISVVRMYDLHDNKIEFLYNTQTKQVVKR